MVDENGRFKNDKELKPCPFCGGGARISEHDHGHIPVYTGACNTVGCFLYYGAMIYTDKEEAKRQWNKRNNDTLMYTVTSTYKEVRHDNAGQEQKDKE